MPVSNPPITTVTGSTGTGLLYGTGAPGGGVGVNGDSYVDTTNSRLYGPKASGVWPSTYQAFGGVLPTSSTATVSTLACSSTAALARASNASALSLLVQNPHATNILYWGTTSGVTSGNGIAIAPGASKRSGVQAGSDSDGYTGDVYLVCASGQTITAVLTKVG